MTINFEVAAEQMKTNSDKTNYYVKASTKRLETEHLLDANTFLSVCMVPTDQRAAGVTDSVNELDEFVPSNMTKKILSNDLQTQVSQLIHENPYFPIIPNEYGELPLCKIWRTYQPFFYLYINHESDLERVNNPLRSVWRAIVILLHGTRHLQRIPIHAPGENELHASAATFCPMDLVRFIVKIFPNYAMQKDSHGRLPLHLAALSKLDVYINEEMEEYRYNLNNISESKSNPYPVRSDVGKLKIIIQSYPSAVCAFDSRNRLPLHYAIEEGVHSACKKSCDIDTIYELFHTLPDVPFYFTFNYT